MARMNTGRAAGPLSADITPERMRSLLDRQRTAFVHDGAPAYEQRIDRMNRSLPYWQTVKRYCQCAQCRYGHRSAEGTLLVDGWSVIENYKYTTLHLREWMQTEVHEAMFPDRSPRRVRAQGRVGVVSPWNFPWRLAFVPIGYVFAAGNRCMLKPSELTPATSALWQSLRRSI